MTTATARGTGGDGGARPTQGNIYAEVTARIIAELEGGRVPWVQPWAAPNSGGTAAPAMPRNAVTGRAYSGINVLILWGTAFDRGFASHGWLTFRQALDAGGAVRKGERGTTVVYADRFIPDAEKARAVDSGDIARAVPFLKRFTVFNIDQCEGLPADPSPDPVPLAEREVEPVAEALIAASGIAVRIGGARAYYSPAEDVVVVPPQPTFFDQINYYRTCLHELSHATGHPSRLGRQLLNPFGSKDYAREELVAEMGAAFLCASLGIVPTVRHADYIASWLDVLRGDDRAIFRAASAASKAADWLLARHRAAPSSSTDADTADAVSPPSRTRDGGLIMDLLTSALRATLRANADSRIAAVHAGRAEPDPAPVVKLFNPLGAATWLATELDSDGDTLFGLADLGFGCPELGSFSLREIAAVRLPFGLGIERDLTFDSLVPLSVWSEAARCEGSISAAEMRLARARAAPDPDHRLPPDTGG